MILFLIYDSNLPFPGRVCSRIEHTLFRHRAEWMRWECVARTLERPFVWP